MRERPEAPDPVLNYHRWIEELLTVEGDILKTFHDAFTHCQAVHAGAHDNDYYHHVPEPKHPEEDDELETNEEDTPSQSCGKRLQPSFHRVGLMLRMLRCLRAVSSAYLPLMFTSPVGPCSDAMIVE